MQEHSLTTRKANDTLETVDSEEDLSAYLEKIAPFVGWIIIYFNSLEDTIVDCLREALLRDRTQNERLDIFLSNYEHYRFPIFSKPSKRPSSSDRGRS